MTKRTSVSPPSPVSKPKLAALVARGKPDPSAVRTLRCRTIAGGRFHQLNYVRGLPPQFVSEDKPEGLLAEISGPNASEALLAALGSCLAVGIHANAVAQNIPVRSLELDLAADAHETGVLGATDLNPKTIGFEAVRVVVRIDAEASHETLSALVRHATLWSPVANTLHNPVHVDVTLAVASRSTRKLKVAERPKQ